MTSYLNVSAESRIQKRSSLRNLETFLGFDFLPGSRLGMSDKNIYGTHVDLLKSSGKNNLPFSSYFMSRWFRAYDLKNVCEHISNQVPKWREILSNDEDKLVALERKLAILERVVIVYDQTKKEKQKDYEKINFRNPIKRLLRVEIHYPKMLDDTNITLEKTSVVRDISYDRLTSKENLTALAIEAINTPIPIKFMGDKKWDSSLKSEIAFNAVPSHIFKSVLQNPSEPADPAKESIHSKVQTIDVTFDQIDWPSIACLLYAQGQNEAMPRVYRQGFIDGRKIGFSENLSSITAEINKAVKK